MSADYADRWAERENTVNRMSADEKRTYTMGLSNAYADVFDVFTAAFSGAMPRDIHAVFERISAQWDDVHATQVVRGAL